MTNTSRHTQGLLPMATGDRPKVPVADASAILRAMGWAQSAYAAWRHARDLWHWRERILNFQDYEFPPMPMPFEDRSLAHRRFLATCSMITDTERAAWALHRATLAEHWAMQVLWAAPTDELVRAWEPPDQLPDGALLSVEAWQPPTTDPHEFQCHAYGEEAVVWRRGEWFYSDEVEDKECQMRMGRVAKCPGEEQCADCGPAKVARILDLRAAPPEPFGWNGDMQAKHPTDDLSVGVDVLLWNLLVPGDSDPVANTGPSVIRLPNDPDGEVLVSAFMADGREVEIPRMQTETQTAKRKEGGE